jgi:hypothetical protein
MKGLMIPAIFFGICFLILPTALRFFSPTITGYSFFKRFVYSLRSVDPRSNRYDGTHMMLQITGILWLLLGVGYKILVNSFSISGVVDDLIVLVVLFGPGAFLFMVFRILQSKYWEKHS